jgi:hydrogenase-4 component F
MAALLLWLSLGGPFGLAVAALLLPGGRWARVAGIAAAGLVLACGGGLLATSTGPGAEPARALGGLLRVDALAAYLLVVVGAVGLTATWGGLHRARAGWTGRGRTGDRRDRRYAALVCLFLTAMVLAAVADDLGVTWVGVEGTTIATAFLVGHEGGRRAVEAAWKYVLLASVGVSIAFLGLVLLYAAARAAGTPTLSWVTLTTQAPAVDPVVTRTGLALAALGFATKAGLAPMHSWLPDAHSQAPGPVSGLMSGVLLAVSFGAILRIERLDEVLLHGTTVRGLLLAGGLASLLVAAVLVVTQRDVKRLLAYSSIEHLGLVAVAAGVGGPLALTAMLVHLLVHGLAKASTFVVAGRILAAEGTTAISEVRALLRRRPALAVPFLTGGAVLLGLPPSGLFLTETAIVVAGFRRGDGWVMAAALVLVLVAFAGIGRHLLAMTLGAVPEAAAPGAVAEPGGGYGPLAPIVLALAASSAVVLVSPLDGVLTDVVAVLGASS